MTFEEEIQRNLSNNFTGDHYSEMEEKFYFDGTKAAKNFENEAKSDLRYTVNLTTGSTQKVLAFTHASLRVARKPEVITFNTAAPVAGQTIFGNGAVTTGKAVRMTGGAFHYITETQYNEIYADGLSYDSVTELNNAGLQIDCMLDSGIEGYIYNNGAGDFLKVTQKTANKPLRSFLEFVGKNASRVIKTMMQIRAGGTDLTSSAIVVQPYQPFTNEGDDKIFLDEFFDKYQTQNSIIEIPGSRFQLDDQNVIYINLPANTSIDVTFSVGAIDSGARKLKVIAAKATNKIETIKKLSKPVSRQQ